MNEETNYILEKSSTQIGTLSEKSLHRIVKNYLELDEIFHEVKIGKYYADIFKDKHITEIQTKHFNKLREKLDFFLEDYSVEIVYPTYRRKTLFYLDPETMEIKEKRLSPKIGNIHEIFPELYKIKQYLKHPKLSIRIILFDLEEYRILDGTNYKGRRKSISYNRIPKILREEVLINQVSDYSIFIPDGIKNDFTSKDFRKLIKQNLRRSQIALNILYYLGIVERTGKDGNSYLYSVVDE